MKTVKGIKSAAFWEKLHRRTYAETHPSIRFIEAVQADALRVAGNTAAQPGVTKRKAAIEVLEAASALERNLPIHLK